jgi:hypothetical protein
MFKQHAISELYTGCVHDVTRGITWGRGHVPRKGDKRDAHRVLGKRPEGKSHLEDLGVDERKIEKWIFKTWIDLAQDRDRWRACECGNEHLNP